MLSNSFLKEEIDEINNLKNILLCKNYYEKYRNYKICAISDLVIAEYTSMVDECLSQKKAVIVHDFNNNLNSYAKNFFTYLPSKIFCSNSYDLESKVQDFFSNDGDLKSFFEDYFQKIEIFNTKEIINKNLEEIIQL